MRLTDGLQHMIKTWIENLKALRIYAVMCRFFNFIILGRYRVEIETPQFLGSQENFYMMKQIGWIYLVTLKFKQDKNRGGNHDVQFHSIKDAYKSIVRWL